MRKHRLYAPFIKIDNRWVRATWLFKREDGANFQLPYTALRKESAVRRYQNWLLASAMGETQEIRELRPLTPKQYKEEMERKMPNDGLGDGRMRRFVETEEGSLRIIDETHTDET